MIITQATIILAQAAGNFADVDADWLKTAIIAIAAGAATYYYIKKGREKIPADEQRYAAKESMDKLEGRIDKKLDQLEASIKQGLEKLNDAGEMRATKYHDRINEHDRSIASLDTITESHTRQIYTLETKLQRHIETHHNAEK